ncbi:hypothetical protein PJL18_04360 [Paenarthrobacter nicotinovorans]|nr:hypothetical protein [Paenarthrobacter nicotinovorans]
MPQSVTPSGPERYRLVPEDRETLKAIRVPNRSTMDWPCLSLTVSNSKLTPAKARTPRPTNRPQIAKLTMPANNPPKKMTVVSALRLASPAERGTRQLP